MSKRPLLALIAVIATVAGPVAWAADRDHAQQLALQFTKLCLGRLTPNDVSRRANQMGLIQTRVRTLGETRIISWRASKLADDLSYSLDVSSLPQQRMRIVGCSVGGRDMPVTDVIAALAQPSRLGKSNDDNAPSLMARKAGWFFIKHGEPNWVSVMNVRLDDDQTVVVGISTHQKLRQ